MVQQVSKGIFLKTVFSFIRVTRDGTFLPIIKYDFLQTRHNDLVRITRDNETMDARIIYTPVSLGKLRLVLHVEAAMQGFKRLGFSDKDVDEVKGIYADTNLYLLVGTIFIASMHVSTHHYCFLNFIVLFDSSDS